MLRPAPTGWCCCRRSTSPGDRRCSWSRAAGSEKRFGDPRAAAQRWQDAGAEWIHLVDLDAAFGRGNNAEIVAELTSHLRLNVELSGGIRDDESLERALATGCARVNIGTAALERPEWCEEIIDRYGSGLPLASMSEEQARCPRLDPGGRRPLSRRCIGWTAQVVPDSSSPTYPPTACFTAPTSSCWAGCVRRPTSR